VEHTQSRDKEEPRAAALTRRARESESAARARESWSERASDKEEPRAATLRRRRQRIQTQRRARARERERSARERFGARERASERQREEKKSREKRRRAEEKRDLSLEPLEIRHGQLTQPLPASTAPTAAADADPRR